MPKRYKRQKALRRTWIGRRKVCSKSKVVKLFLVTEVILDRKYDEKKPQRKELKQKLQQKGKVEEIFQQHERQHHLNIVEAAAVTMVLVGTKRKYYGRLQRKLLMLRSSLPSLFFFFFAKDLWSNIQILKYCKTRGHLHDFKHSFTMARKK